MTPTHPPRSAWLLALALLAAPALAHETKRDGDVAALLHLEPDDDPVAGRPLVTWFEATRRGGSPVTASACACTVSVYRGAAQPNAKPVSSVPARDGTAGNARGKLSATLTLPEAGAYTIALEGRPRSEGEFRPFRLEWIVRADEP